MRRNERAILETAVDEVVDIIRDSSLELLRHAHPSDETSTLYSVRQTLLLGLYRD